MTNIYRANEAAAFIHDFMCNNKEFCGYTQGHDRWGQNLGKKVDEKINSAFDNDIALARIL